MQMKNFFPHSLFSQFNIHIFRSVSAKATGQDLPVRWETPPYSRKITHNSAGNSGNNWPLGIPREREREREIEYDDSKPKRYSPTKERWENTGGGKEKRINSPIILLTRDHHEFMCSCKKLPPPKTVDDIIKKKKKKMAKACYAARAIWSQEDFTRVLGLITRSLLNYNNNKKKKRKM